MDLSQLIADLKTTYVDFTAGKVLTAWEDTLKVQQTTISLARQLTGFQGGGTVTFAAQAGQCDELALACNDLQSCCDHPPTMGANDPVGKLGDGVILGQLVNLLKVVLPLILSLFAKPNPAPLA